MAQGLKQPKHSLPEFHLETLEKRILFSADAAFTALDVAPEPVAELVVLHESQNKDIAEGSYTQEVNTPKKNW